MIGNLPLFEFIIDEDEKTGVKCVSIVSDPAFGSALIAFKNKPKYITLADKKKQIVAGLSLIPNVPVYRFDDEVGEYYGYFSMETIQKIVDRYHEEMLSNQVNLEHDSNSYIDAYMVEDFIVDSEGRIQDLKAKGIEHENIMGAWYTAFKIKDEDVYNSIISSGNATGFSVEAYLDKIIKSFNNEVKNNLISNKVKSEMKKINKSLKEKILSIFADVESFERALVPELAFEIEWSEVGAPVNKVIVSPEGNETLQPVGQGEFITESGIIVVDEASNLVEVRDLPAEPIVDELPEVPELIDESSEEVMVEDEVETVTGDTAPFQPMAKGVDLTIASLVDLTKNGFYMIDVYVENGQIVNATMTSQMNLLSKQEEIDALKLEKQALEDKMKDPITDPILEPVTIEKDFSKMTAYEKIMYNRGLKPV